MISEESSELSVDIFNQCKATLQSHALLVSVTSVAVTGPRCAGNGGCFDGPPAATGTGSSNDDSDEGDCDGERSGQRTATRYSHNVSHVDASSPLNSLLRSVIIIAVLFVCL